MKRLFVILLTIICCSALSAARANTLYGRVIAVHDGQTMTIENTGRSIKVALMHAAPPEKDQPYADIARQHLADLVLNRQVTVEYTGLGAGNQLVARVFCDNRDIGLQMIRDGVAWFDRREMSELDEAERRVYAASEEAARNEHRGLWHDGAPTPPWEWQQAKSNALNKQSRTVVASSQSAPAANESSPGRAVSNSSVASSHSSSASDKPTAPGWLSFSPSDKSFSINAPGAGKQLSIEIDDPEGRAFTAQIYLVEHLKIGYLVMWASGPAVDRTLDDIFERGRDILNESVRAHGLPCEYVMEKDTAMKGYTGRRYRMTGCYFHGSLRVYFKREGQTLKMRLVGSMSENPGDPLVNKFLDSFVIN